MTTAEGTALPAELGAGGLSKSAHELRTLGFMPRILVLTTLPHSRPESHYFGRINGRYSLRLEARRSIGLPFGVYPRLILIYLTTKAVCTKSPKIDLGRTPNELGSQARSYAHQRTTRHLQETSRPTAAPPFHPIPLAVLQGLPNARERTRPDCVQRPHSEAPQGVLPKATANLESRARPQPPVLSRNYPLRRTGRSPSHRTTEGLSTGDRHLHLAHPPDELPPAAMPDSMESLGVPVWSHLCSVSGFSPEFLHSPS